MPRITPAGSEDIRQLAELEELVFSYDRISRRQFRYLTTKANSIVVKAEYRGDLAGYMVLLRRRTSSKLRIYSLAVVHSLRKRGIARKLLAYAETVALQEQLHQLTLEVCEHNDCAMRLYYYAGFRFCGRKSDYYENGCSALLLGKTLRSEGRLQ